MHVAVMALTFQRPAGLRTLLDGLSNLTFARTAKPPASGEASTSGERPGPGSMPELTFVIVDNDPEGSGRAICDEMRGQLPGRLHYVLEARRGISHGRNRALAESLELGADLLCFIDDDECPKPNWLDELIAAHQRYDADVVAGPVLSIFPEGTPPWIVSGGFFDLRRFPTGTRIEYAYTNNVLMRARMLRDLDCRFDTRWALLGGGDVHFFRRLARQGRSIVWCDEAIVHETVPATRANPQWLRQRAYRTGNAMSMVKLDLNNSTGTRAVLLAKATVWMVIGTAYWPAGLFSPLWGMRGARARRYGYGMLTGLFGRRFQEYSTTHGG